ncbi:signal peptidase I [Megalodesulfovibrio gigas]|uniref:Signal peptidase I n=1 Tax=Megalodesulfovibrio gigas (strain ATCC 19364 / DSM 1382 / NCIMB 9332 / VKM B-1759) TaxID=1121448 RepID=T2GBU7_MEGG1|nr:signal peptidase I [Megalodesulfovibrio gigas]AGW13581.1 putative signal peptidase I [Megalodesulfovibrio gigas DSM 1382 = ATCC 19364]
MTPRWQKMLKEYAEALIIAFVLAMFIRAFVVQAFTIPSGSMLQTLQIGDYLLVSKLSYGIKVPFTHSYLTMWATPEHGDIIVFENPNDPSKDFIKRVIGMPGDTIEIKDKKVYRNGQALDESYVQFVDPNVVMGPRDHKDPIVVPDGNYFVMGDNRDDSLDSRFWGFVPVGNLRGKAWMIYWSWESMGSIRWNRIGTLVH